jgi:putative Ca2+/H+ antiporter (TMEM165/GDT1 family)
MSFDMIQDLLLPFLTCAGFVTLNEMGDKTQFLAMALATRIRFFKVMLGVLIATIINHGLAVAVGSLLASVPGWQGLIKLIASFMFIIFGLWALKSDKFNDKADKKSKYGDVATVAVSFFFAEMGDKTQLSTIALAASYPKFPLIVLAGTTTGMLIADGIGIVAGVFLHKKLPEPILKLFAAVAFILFGIGGLWEALSNYYKFPLYIYGSIVVFVSILSLITGNYLYKKQVKSYNYKK